MYDYLIDEAAVGDLAAAEHAYLEYFMRFGEYEKGVRWAEAFFSEYRTRIEELKAAPRRHPFCRVYPFDCGETRYRSFVVGWFTVFYTVEEGCFIVWAVKSSKSDFRALQPSRRSKEP